MSHNISAILFPPSELVDISINVVNLPKGWKMTTLENYVFDPEWDLWKLSDLFIEKYKNYLNISTDYFGGCGKQECRIYKFGKFLKKTDNINEGLRFFGLENDKGMDGFDTINLGHYRTNGEIEEAYANQEKEKIDLKNTIFYLPFSDDWYGIYVNGELLTEGHSINITDLINRLIDNQVSMGELNRCELNLDKKHRKYNYVNEYECGEKFHDLMPQNLDDYIVGCQELGYKVEIKEK